MLLVDGVAVGQMVVTAGVNLLKPGQKVTILGADPVVAQEQNGRVAKIADVGAAK